MSRSLLTNAATLPTYIDYWLHRIHAFLGCYVLCHFIYRYYAFFSNHNDMGFNIKNDNFIQLFLPHLLLQCTGFTFNLPSRRHPDGNRIWPQYRWEALIFCCRCISLAYIAWRRKYGYVLEDCSMIPALICLVTMILADINSRWYMAHDRSNYSQTIRGLSAPKWSQYLMSSAQFHATVHCLLTSNRLSVQIAALTVVQLSAFGMTLRRKGYITQKEGVVLYAMVLVLGMIVIVDDLQRRSLINLAFFFGNTAAVFRMYLRMNKYYLWGGIVVVLTVLLRQGLLNDEVVPYSLVMNVSSWILLLGSCYLKHR